MVNANGRTIDCRSPRNQKTAQRESARSVRSRRYAALRRDRSHLGLRRHFTRSDSEKGRGPESVERILVQQIRQDRQSLRRLRFRSLSKTIAAVPRSIVWPLDDREENATAPGGMRRARLSRGFGLERIPAIAKRLWNQTTGRLKAGLEIAGAHLYSRDQSRDRPRRTHRHETLRGNSGRGDCRPGECIESRHLLCGPRSRRKEGNYSSGYQIRVRNHRWRVASNR